VYYLLVNKWVHDLVRAYYFYSPCNQTTSCQYKLSKRLVQRIIETQSVLPYNGTRVLSQNNIYVLVRVRAIKPHVLAHSCYNPYVPNPNI